MKTQWNHQNRTPFVRSLTRLRARSEATPLRQRIDLVLLVMLVSATLVLSGIWSFGVGLSNRYGVFDPPVVQPIADERLTSNVRDDLVGSALRDAVYHAPERRIYAAQEGGVIHTYDPATRLWTSERPFAGEHLITSELSQLRSGCGRDVEAARSDLCPDPKTIWAMSEHGGLLRRTDGAWHVVMGDVAWTGKRGTTVQQDALSAAAVSDDGRWLAIGTSTDGVGLYDNARGTWAAQSVIRAATTNPTTTTTIVWWEGRFWLGGPQGMVTLQPNESQPAFAPVTDRTGTILDLDVGDDGLYILERHACTEGSTTCLWLGRLASPDSAATVLFDEHTVYANLNSENLVFAQQWGRRLVVAGAAGIFAYNMDLHTWERLFDKEVRLALAQPDGQGFYFVHPGGAGQLDSSGYSHFWKLDGDQMIRLLFGRDSREVLALTGNGNLLALGSSETPDVLYRAEATHFDPTKFTLAADLGDTTFFLGPEGVLLHNLATRTYLDIPTASLPPWMQQPGLRAYRAGNDVYFVRDQALSMQIYPVSAQALANPAVYTDTMRAISSLELHGPAQRVWDWNSAGLGVIDAEGSVYAVTPKGVDRRTGKAQSDLDTAALLDVTAQNDNLVVATSAGVRYYGAAERGWIDGPSPQQRIVELGVLGNQLLGRSDHNELLQIANSSQLLIGSQEGSQIPDSDLSDSRLTGSDLYLAGGGVAELYNLDQRRISKRWKIAAQGPLRIRGVINSVPLIQSADAAFLGDQAIDPAAGPVVNLADDGTTIWTTRRAEDHLYLKGYASTGPFDGNTSTCSFRNPWTPTPATRVVDARRLPNGSLAVATDAGLMFYAPASRSWYGVPGVGAAGARLYLLGDYLAVAEPINTPTTLTLVPLNSVRLPDSCATGTISLNPQPIPVQGATFDEAAAKVAWVAPNGSVMEWHAGQTREVLATPDGPDATKLRRVYQRDSYLLFTTDDSLWRYTLANHQWQQVNLRFSDKVTATLDINIEGNSSAETVTARAAGDRWYVGQFTPPADGVSMNQLVDPPQRTFQATANDLLDVSNTGGKWTFLLTDRLKYFDPAQRTWADDVPLDGTDATRKLFRALDRWVVVGNGGKTWSVATETGFSPTAFARFDVPSNEQIALDKDGTIWHLNRNGELSRCVNEKAAYRCERANDPPMPLATSDVRHAYSWQGVTVFDTTTGLRAFDPQRGTEIPISDTVRMAPVTLTREYQGRLLLHDGATLVDLQHTNTNVVSHAWQGVNDLVFDTRGVPWAHFGNEWRRFDNNDWAVPRLGDGRSAAEAGVRVFASEGTTPVGVDRSGTLYSWTTILAPEPLALPTNINAATIDWLVAGTDHSWWVRSGQRLSHVVTSTCAAPTAVATPQATAVVSTTTTVATPIPQAAPCLAIGGSVDLPPNFTALPAAVELVANGINLTLASGERAEIRAGASGASYQLSSLRGAAPQLTGAVADPWSQLRAYVRPLASGGTAFDPITDLALDQAGSVLNVVRPSIRTRIADQAVLQPGPALALDVGWLRWDRSGSNFVLNGTTLRKDQFIVDNALIIEPVGALLAETPNHFAIANQYGVWDFHQSDAHLDGKGISFTPIALNGISGAAHGRFLLANGDLPLATKALQPIQPGVPLTLDDMSIVEQIRDRNLTATLTRAGAKVAALNGTSFVFDHQRSGLAYTNSDLYIQSEAGIHPAQPFGPFDTGPPGVASGRLVSEPSGPLLYNAAGSWYQRNTTGWQPLSTDPTSTHTLFKDQTWSWELRGGNLQITLAQGQALNFALGPSGPGFGFSSDHLRAATLHNGALFVMSDAFTELASKRDQLATLAASRLPPDSVDRLESLAAADGSLSLFRFIGTDVSRWNDATQHFDPVPAADNPDAVWRLVESPRLRLTRRGADVTKELRLDNLGGGDRWLNFDFQEGRFPFDQVTSFDIQGNQLYVGSAAGLQVYPNGQSLGLNQLDKLYDLSGSSTGGLAPVTRVGRPRNDPTLVMARANVCVELHASGAPQLCRDASQLDTRLRIATDLWEWTADATNALSGVYHGRGGSPTLPVRVVDGRFLHDRLRDVGVCQSTAFSVWEDGWMTTYPDATIALHSGMTHDALSDFDPQRLLCLERDVRVAGGVAQAGMYTLGKDTTFRHYNGSGWDAVSGAVVTAALRERLERAPIVDRASLRLLPPAANNSLVFEQQTIAGAWQQIPWDTDRVAVDRWREVVAVGDQLWAATPAGLIDFARKPSEEIVLDPDHLVVVREPADTSNLCIISDLRYVDAKVLTRCGNDSKQIYSGVLDGTHDTNIFSRMDGADPFASTTFVDRGNDNVWEWTLSGRKNGDAGQVKATRVRSSVPEAIQLVGGRFDFDEISSLALFRDNQLEIASSAGWFETPSGTFAADAWKRPSTTNPQPATVRSVGIARAGDDRFLCLFSDAGSARLSVNGTSEAGRCAEFLGTDSLWRYEREQSNNHMVALGKDGEGERRLVDGRFGDDTVTGLPLAVSDATALAYLLPTAAGVVRMDATFAKRTILATFAQLPAGSSPTALYLWDSASPAYYADGALYRLGDNTRLADLQLDLPSGATIQSLEDGPRALLDVKWALGNQHGWSLYARDVGRTVARNRLVVDVRSLDRYQQNRVEWQALSPAIETDIQPNQVALYWPNPTRAIMFPYPQPIDIVATIAYDDRLLVFGRHEMYEVNMGPALLQAYGSR